MTTRSIAIFVLSLLALLGVLLWLGSGSSKRAGALAPLDAPNWRVELGVPGYGDVSVSVPLGARQPRPVVVVLHGEHDRPEWQCGTWRAVVGDRAFVLCPRGRAVAGTKTFTFDDRRDTELELRGSLRALKERFGPYVAKGSVVLAGFGVGAEYAVALARAEPSFFSRLVLVEGGTDAWTASAAGIFEHGGGVRVLFACSSAPCRELADQKLSITRSLDLDGKVVFAGELGGVFDGRLARALSREYAWLMSSRAPKPSSAPVIPLSR